MERLQNKVAIITGAASGIGLGTAEVFAEHGARLVLVDIDATGLSAALSQIQALGAKAVMLAGDVSVASVISGAVQLALDTFGRVDVVFNNAGIMPHGDLVEFGEASWDRALNVNLKAMFLMCRAVVPIMLAQGSGSIINTSSVMAYQTEPGYDAYTSSKAGIIGLTKSVAVAYAERNVRCNCICPGWVETAMNVALAEEIGGMEALYPIIKQQQPSARMATPREIGNVVLFLASDESSAVTGSIIAVDGGASAAI